jgi:PAS domain S-box-containing protein
LSSTDKASTVLVLDDDESVRDALRLRLERSGFDVLTAGSYEELTRVMRNCDAVLCDIILPGNSGLQALEWVRTHFPDTPVIMMTGKPTYETAAEAIRLGAYDYLAKPINKNELLHALERAVQHRRLTLDKARLEAENSTYRLHLEQRVEEQTQALRESQEFLTTITDTMADAVFSIRLPDYRIEYVNQAAEGIFGYQPEELMGQTMHVLYPDVAKFKAFNQKQAIALALGQMQIRLEQSMQRKDGQTVWTEIVATFIQPDGQLTQIIAVIRDITQRSFLLGVVAHELRSPLGLLKGFSVAMMDDLESIDRQSLKTYLGVIDDSSSRMLKLVNELLDVTKIELGQVPLDILSSDLAELLRAHCRDYTYVARKKNIRLKEVLFSEPLICQCDANKIGQVMANFIDNAIKYSPTDTTIEIIGNQLGSNIWVGVSDDGPGIKPDEKQHLFKSFEHNKISSKPTAGEKSSGLGLAICKKIIEAHHGEIGVDSAPGRGSTFWFSVPM